MFVTPLNRPNKALIAIINADKTRGWNTIEKIISHWAPPNENDTKAYIAFVEYFSDVPRNQKLTATDGANYILIVSAMSCMENGKNAELSEIQAGFNLQSSCV